MPTNLVSLTKQVICLFSMCALSACMSVQPNQKLVQDEQFQSFHLANKPVENTQTLQSIVQTLVQDLLFTNTGLDVNSMVAVTDFVVIGSNFEQAGQLSQHLSQNFITELHRVGVSTVDYLVTNEIRVTYRGNLAMSKDFMDLTSAVDATCILVGTITEDANGYVIHTRIVNNADKLVLATANSFIPYRMTASFRS